jgi:Tfp pilus assembly protein PilF
MQQCPNAGLQFAWKARFSRVSRSAVSALLLSTLAYSVASAQAGQSSAETQQEASLKVLEATPVGASQPGQEQVGDALMHHKRFSAAINAYKQAPESSVVWNKIGVAYQMMLNLPQAIRSYQQALKLDPKNGRALNNLGTAYDAMREPGKAERMYREAIRVNRNDAMFHRNLGSSLIAQLKFAEGWASYQNALDLDPKVFEKNAASQAIQDGAPRDRGAMNYFMARGCARAGKQECALRYLRKSINEGFVNAKKIEADTDFASLMDLPEFQELLALGTSDHRKSFVQR